MHNILPEIGIAVLAATALGFIFQLCRQPVILGYLVAGALIGPEIGLKLVSDPANIEVISEIGLILSFLSLVWNSIQPIFFHRGKNLFTPVSASLSFVV